MYIHKLYGQSVVNTYITHKFFLCVTCSLKLFNNFVFFRSFHDHFFGRQHVDEENCYLCGYLKITGLTFEVGRESATTSARKIFSNFESAKLMSSLVHARVKFKAVHPSWFTQYSQMPFFFFYFLVPHTHDILRCRNHIQEISVPHTEMGCRRGCRQKALGRLRIFGIIGICLA